jgi:hypothetical protein
MCLQGLSEKGRKEENTRNTEIEMGDNIKVEPKENGWEVWAGLVWLGIGNNGVLL